jgi:hypothetical protein
MKQQFERVMRKDEERNLVPEKHLYRRRYQTRPTLSRRPGFSIFPLQNRAFFIYHSRRVARKKSMA